MDSLVWIRRSRRSESDGNGFAGMDLTEWIGVDLLGRIRGGRRRSGSMGVDLPARICWSGFTGMELLEWI